MRAPALLLFLGQLAWAGGEVCLWSGRADVVPSSEVFAPRAPWAFAKLTASSGEVQLSPRPGPWSQRMSALLDLKQVRLDIELLPAEPLTLSLRGALRFGVFTSDEGRGVSVKPLRDGVVITIVPTGIVFAQGARATSPFQPVGRVHVMHWSRLCDSP